MIFKVRIGKSRSDSGRTKNARRFAAETTTGNVKDELAFSYLGLGRQLILPRDVVVVAVVEHLGSVTYFPTQALYAMTLAMCVWSCTLWNRWAMGPSA